MAELVKTVCCGHERFVTADDMEDMQYKPYQSGNFIECPDCGMHSRLFRPNKAAVVDLQLKQQQQAAEHAEDPTTEKSIF